MPKEITKYLCKICGAEYYEEKDAVICENLEVDNIEEARLIKDNSELIYIESVDEDNQFQYESRKCEIIGQVIMKDASVPSHHIALVFIDPQDPEHERLAYFDRERNQWVSSSTMIFEKGYYDYYLDFMKSIE